jgi:hypothetical protein
MPTGAVTAQKSNTSLAACVRFDTGVSDLTHPSGRVFVF